MSLLMQLPSLYGVRGAIATQTMANLDEQQKEYLNEIVQKIANDPSLAADKFEFIRQLGNTIGGDYKSDRSVAEHEFIIAIWRATTYLLYHKDYSYSCLVCSKQQYITSKNTKKAFDRQYPICPNCHSTIIENSICKLDKSDKKYRIVDENGNVLIEEQKRQDIEKHVTSPIKAIAGDNKIEDPYVVLNDSQQRSKWYSVWIWNYFRQILNENIIKTHNKHETEISGPAHHMAARELISEIDKLGYKYYFEEPIDDTRELEIIMNIYSTNKSFVGILVHLTMKYRNYGVEISEHRHGIKIEAKCDPPIMHTTISTEDPVIMLSFSSPSNNNNDSDDDTGNWSDVLESRAIGHISQDHSVIDNEWIESTRNNMPDDITRAIFDIYSQTGECWEKFSTIFGTKSPAKSHIAKFLNVSIKTVEDKKEVVKQICKEMCIGGDDDLDNHAVIIERGDVATIVENNGHTCAHSERGCGSINWDGMIYDDEVIGIREQYIKVRDLNRLVRMCPDCCRVD